ALPSEARGRRVFPANPDFSLLLRKASGQVPHGGGKKLPEAGPAFATLRRWVIAGCPRTPADAPTVAKITVSPDRRIMGFNAEQQLSITAHYSDGTTEDVTHLAAFSSSESVYAAV